MQNRYYSFNSGGGSGMSTIIGIAFLVLMIAGIFLLVRGMYYVLSFLAPVLLIATFFIDKSVLTAYVQWLVKLFRDNVISGLLMVILTAIGFPFVAGFLFAKALLKRKIRKMTSVIEKQQSTKYSEYEEIESEPADKPVEIPKIIQMPRPQSRNQYDDFFEEEQR